LCVPAIIEDVDGLISADADLALLEIEHPEILTPKGSVDKYG
jgi:hypothetical protein